MKRAGKRTIEWLEYRTQWLDTHSEPYYCVVGNGKMDRQHVTLDHDIPRSKRPDLRLDDENINTMCGFHNHDKGSRTLEKYLQSNPDRKCRNY